MNIRVKFYCSSNIEVEYNYKPAWHINMIPVFESQEAVKGQACEENKIFGKWIPAGNLDMTIVNPYAAKQFKIGKSYYLDFKEV